MLTISPRALAVIRKVTAHPTLAPTSGLRIARRDEEDAPLHVCAVAGAREGDRVHEEDGARLIIGPGLTDLLTGELDAETLPSGEVQFGVRRAS